MGEGRERRERGGGGGGDARERQTTKRRSERKEDEGEMVGFGMRQVQPLALLGRGALRKKRRG